MKQTPRRNLDRVPSELVWGQITTENAYDVDGTLPLNQGISLENVDLFQGYMRTRRSVQSAGFNNNPIQGDILQKTTWAIDGREFMVHQYVTGYWYIDIDDDLDSWTQLNIINFHTNTLVGPVPSGLTRCRFSKAADKLYIFQQAGNVVVELDETSGNLKARELGMGRPAINGSTVQAFVGSAIEPGQYLYAVEYVYRKEIGTPAEADYLASTPQRYTLFDSEPRLFKLNIASSQEVIIDFDTFDPEADTLWTHVKLYRTKKLDPSSVTNEIAGSEETLYLIQRLDRAYINANGKSFIPDRLNDDQLPNVGLGAETVLFPDMDQEALPDGNIGAYHQNRIWMTDIPDDIAGDSEIIYTSATAFKYSEQYDALSRYRCNTGDGQSITDLVTLEEDLIVFKQAQTGRVPNGLPEVEYDVLDSTIGVADRAFFVPKVGIIGLTNDQSDVKIFGYNLSWREDFSGIPFSRPVRGVFDATPPGTPGQPGKDLNGVAYYEGKLYLAASTRIWVFNVGEGLGWSHYELGYINGTEVDAVITDTLGTRCYFNVKGIPATYIFGERDEAEWNGNFMPWKIQTSGYQADKGRGFVEQQYMSMMALLTQPATMDVSITGRDNEIKTDESFALVPNEVNPTVQNVMAEYQYYAEYNHPRRTRIYADRLFYTVESTGFAEIHDLKLYCYIQTGMRPPWASTKAILDNNNGILADLSSGQLHWQTRPDMSQDRVNPNDPTKPFQQIDFILMKAE